MLQKNDYTFFAIPPVSMKKNSSEVISKGKVCATCVRYGDIYRAKSFGRGTIRFVGLCTSNFVLADPQWESGATGSIYHGEVGLSSLSWGLLNLLDPTGSCLMTFIKRGGNLSPVGNEKKDQSSAYDFHDGCLPLSAVSLCTFFILTAEICQLICYVNRENSIGEKYLDACLSGPPSCTSSQIGHPRCSIT